MLCKVNFKENGEVDTSRLTSFRCGIGSEEIVCCFGNGKSESDLSETNNHWMGTDKIKLNENIGYVSITIDTLTGNIKFFQDGVPVVQTTCSTDYLDSGDLFNNDIPFSVGLSVGGDPATVGYDNFDLYACRLYTRVLSDIEIQQNYTATTNYHNELIK